MGYYNHYNGLKVKSLYLCRVFGSNNFEELGINAATGV